MGIKNVKEEFLGHIRDSVVLCAKIDDFILPVDYTKENYENFLKALDFTYDAGYGSQNIYGTIWYNDGTWSERGEYDGSEWWVRRRVPPIPSILTNSVDDAYQHFIQFLTNEERRIFIASPLYLKESIYTLYFDEGDLSENEFQKQADRIKHNSKNVEHDFDVYDDDGEIIPNTKTLELYTKLINLIHNDILTKWKS